MTRVPRTHCLLIYSDHFSAFILNDSSSFHDQNSQHPASMAYLWSINMFFVILWSPLIFYCMQKSRVHLLLNIYQKPDTFGTSKCKIQISLWSVEWFELQHVSAGCAGLFFTLYVSYAVAQPKPRNHFNHTVNHCTETCVFVSVVWDLLTSCFFSPDTSRNFTWFAVQLCPGLTYKGVGYFFDVYFLTR